MKPRSKSTLQKYRLTEEAFAALWQSQDGCCAICGISEEELTEKHREWRADQVLQIDHEQGTHPYRVRGLLCKDCNYDLEACIRKAPVVHPAGRGESLPRNDSRFKAYLKRTAVSRAEKRKYHQPGPAETRRVKERALLDEWSQRLVTVKFKDGSERTGMLLDIPEECAFHLFGPDAAGDDYENPNHAANQLHFVKEVLSIRAAQ